ncbi:MAG: hypothetical protein NT140_08955 [Deltaproteobacteria bacterium]|nr:hypothetical protein [Deltaproteobacteria bacterium]
MLENFIGKSQMAAILSYCKGEEGEFYRAMLEKLENQIATMPKTYETDGQGEAAFATLHYFYGGSDWWIVEKDEGSPDDTLQGQQLQAFGFACLNGDKENAELGYINIEELISNGVELDLYYTPQTIGAIMERLGKL